MRCSTATRRQPISLGSKMMRRAADFVRVDGNEDISRVGRGRGRGYCIGNKEKEEHNQRKKEIAKKKKKYKMRKRRVEKKRIFFFIPQCTSILSRLKLNSCRKQTQLLIFPSLPPPIWNPISSTYWVIENGVKL